MHGLHPRTGLLLGLMTLTTLFSAQLADAQVQLQYRFAEGQSRRYELKQTLTTSADVSGQVMTNRITQNLLLGAKVQKVQPDGTAVLAKTIERIQMEATQPGVEEPLRYDSNSGQELAGPFGVIANSLAALVQQEILVTMSPRGEVQDVDIPQALLEQFSGGPGLAGMNSPEAIERMLSQGSVVFPDRPLQRNDTWTRELSTELPFGRMNSQIEFTYAGRTKEGFDRIDAVTRISLEPKPNSPFQIEMKTADGEGVYLFDPRHGCILASGLKQTMDMELSAIGQSLKQSVTTEISMRLLNPGQTSSLEKP
ncbi:hypothetical protein [Rubinisphaera margarita]|uniref:hypothetical protein n=1 Tax=Rubinisphaera margarita TaxID=2909586 RepID=UPI001EE958EC|nr:hypothetical protein [Rubinisphaera margarita]MCG6155410.1 hypothetical protein [Rubinisphaera margarita]